jgi:sarcosine oxidase gamma subunit
VSDLAFLSPDQATGEAAMRSPLERALARAPEGIEDISLTTGVLEVRGDPGTIEGGEAIRLTPRRTVVITAFDETAALRARLRADGLFVVDMSGGYAALCVRGEAVMRRVTDLDLEDLPAAGALAHVQAVVLRDDAETFRVFVPQEYGHYVAEVIVDAAEGLSA